MVEITLNGSNGVKYLSLCLLVDSSFWFVIMNLGSYIVHVQGCPVVDVILFRSPDYSVYLNFIFSYFCTMTYVVGTHKNRLYEMVLLSTHSACLYYWIRK